MKKIILILIILYICVNWNEVSTFVIGNANSASTNVTKWLVDHTPKK